MARETSADSTSLVSRQLTVEGEITGEENLHVDGCVKGLIRLAGDLFVGASGTVEAEVDARNVVIQGSVSGKITARNQLEIKPSGRLIGECSAASIEIREGAVFEGSARMLTAGAKTSSTSAPPFPAPQKG
jgi:cytoskeletal protein CcmA (bactofilin family)